MATFRDKYIKKYGEDAIGSISKISKVTGIPKSILQQVYNRGSGAWKTNIQSVRLKSGKKDPSAPRSAKMGREQWAMGRVYGFVMKNRKQIGKGQPDRDLYEKQLEQIKNK